MSDRLINMFLRRVKDENEGKLPEPLHVAVVMDGVAAQATFVQLHDGHDVLELIGMNTGNPFFIRTSAVQGIEQIEP